MTLWPSPNGVTVGEHTCSFFGLQIIIPYDPIRHWTQFLPWGDLVEDSPDVLPGLVAGAVEEGVLQPVRPRRRPALADVGQVRAWARVASYPWY